MTRERGTATVLVVTDQWSNHRSHLAFVEAVGTAHGTPVRARHAFCKRSLLRSRNSGNVRAVVRRELERTGGEIEVPVVLFRDSECRDGGRLDDERKQMGELVAWLRSNGVPRSVGVVFNPTSEGACLVFPEAVAVLRTLARPPSVLEPLLDDQLDGLAVHKGTLHRVLGLDDHRRKRELDERLAKDVFGGGLRASGDRVALGAIREVSCILER